jgi:hypothetical protein
VNRNGNAPARAQPTRKALDPQMALKMRSTGLSSGFYKDSVDYSVFCGE